MIHSLQLRVLPSIAANSESLKALASAELSIDMQDITAIRILKQSIDARQRQVMINVKVAVYQNESIVAPLFEDKIYPDVSHATSVVVVGAGPAGLFAALRLIELGIKPIVVERGRNVHDRKKDIANISRLQVIEADSNYSFGEGGAGAFSDGKLYTRSKKRGSIDRILHTFCQHGAATNILVEAHPHIGSDKLPKVIENMRQTILSSGGEVHFETRMNQFLFDTKGAVIGIVTVGGAEFMGKVILATGHSARDVYRYLHHAGIALESKSIAMGVRLEHPQALIDSLQYHSLEGRGDYLPAAEYSYVTQVRERGVYSFCMCPGGIVVPAATDSNQIVVNGMSPSSRSGIWANAGMVVEIRPEDIPLANPDNQLAIMEFQEELERLCFVNGDGKLGAPAQRMADFVKGRNSVDLPDSSYVPGLIAAPLHFLLPAIIGDRLRRGFEEFGRMSRGFLTNEATVIATESRTSSPVRIPRENISMQHITVQGLYPCGEGAGYAGGIVSAAIDGERAAEAVAATL